MTELLQSMVKRRKKQQSQASVQVAIADVLESLSEKYNRKLYQNKCSIIYQHIFDSYYGEGGRSEIKVSGTLNINWRMESSRIGAQNDG